MLRHFAKCQFWWLCFYNHHLSINNGYSFIQGTGNIFNPFSVTYATGLLCLFSSSHMSLMAVAQENISWLGKQYWSSKQFIGIVQFLHGLSQLLSWRKKYSTSSAWFVRKGQSKIFHKALQNECFYCIFTNENEVKHFLYFFLS